jgi:hypothetical protein
VSVVSEQVRRPVATPRRLSPSILSTALPVAVAATVVGWFASIRIRMTTPSLVDDWFAITYSARSLHGLLHGSYLSSHADFVGRYRPAYTGIWNYAQWHLLGRPSVATAAAWGALRVALFILAVCLLTRWIARGHVRHSLILVAPLIVVLTPRVALDLARYGPNEPLMATGIIVGLALMGTSVRRFVAGDSRGWRCFVDGIALLAGYLVYLFGVYSKEVSFCVIAFFPFFLMWLGPNLRTYVPRSPIGKILIAWLIALTIAPLIHVATRLAIATLAGEKPYPVPELGLGTKVFAAGFSPFFGAPGALGTWFWFLAAPAALFVAIELAVRRERDAWLAFGVLISGYLMSAVSLSRGIDPSRYYIPWLVAVAVVGFRGFVRLPRGFRVGLAAVAITTFAYGTQKNVADWVRSEDSGATAIEMAKRVISAGCPLYLANFDLERRVAIPQLFGFTDVERLRSCLHDADQAYAVSWGSKSLSLGFARRCQSKWRRLEIRNDTTLYACASFRRGAIPDQIAASDLPDVTVVHLRQSQRPPDLHLLHQPPGPSAG